MNVLSIPNLKIPKPKSLNYDLNSQKNLKKNFFLISEFSKFLDRNGKQPYSLPKYTKSGQLLLLFPSDTL